MVNNPSLSSMINYWIIIIHDDPTFPSTHFHVTLSHWGSRWHHLLPGLLLHHWNHTRRRAAGGCQVLEAFQVLQVHRPHHWAQVAIAPCCWKRSRCCGGDIALVYDWVSLVGLTVGSMRDITWWTIIDEVYHPTYNWRSPPCRNGLFSMDPGFLRCFASDVSSLSRFCWLLINGFSFLVFHQFLSEGYIQIG